MASLRTHNAGFIRLLLAPLALALVCLAASPTLAADKGQDDLDKATELKLSADSLADLDEVIQLCQKALKAGLGETNTTFAKGLLTGTLIQRAELLCAEILDKQMPSPRWPQLRQLALTDLEEAVKLDATQADAQYLIARLQALPGGDRARAVKALNEVLRLSEKNKAMKAQALVLRANLSEDQKQREADYDEAIKIAPRNVEIVRSRGLYLLLQNKAKEALEDLKTAAELDPKGADTWEALGVAQLMTKNLDDALSSLNKAVELGADSPTTYMHRARVQAMQQKNKEALADLDEALKLAPRSLSILLLRARVHLQAGEKKDALADVNEVLRVKPDSAEARQLHAAISAGAGQLRDAIEDLVKLQQAGSDNAEVLVQLGMFYIADKQPKKAIETFTTALQGEEKSWMAFRGRADAYLSLGQQGDAVKDYQEALKLDPENTGVLNNLAWVLATSPEDKLRSGKKAIELARQACELTEYKEAHILSTLAAAFAEAGDFEHAVEWSQKAVDLDKDQTQLAQELASYKEKKPWREATPPEADQPQEK